MLAEKRKKKTKVLYQESELSIQEAVDHTCDSEDRFKKFNVTSVGGRPEYTKVQGKVAKTEYKKQLAGRRPTGLNLRSEPLAAPASAPRAQAVRPTRIHSGLLTCGAVSRHVPDAASGARAGDCQVLLPEQGVAGRRGRGPAGSLPGDRRVLPRAGLHAGGWGGGRG